MKPITTKDIMNKLLTSEEIAEIENDVKKEVARIRGGKREGSGRKTVIKGKILKFTKRLTDEEVKFIDYAREHHLNYNELMQG